MANRIEMNSDANEPRIRSKADQHRGGGFWCCLSSGQRQLGMRGTHRTCLVRSSSHLEAHRLSSTGLIGYHSRATICDYDE